MPGQIRIYMSYIDENSSDEYIERIKNLIGDVQDEEEKKSLSEELANQIYKINTIRNFKESKKSEDEFTDVLKVSEQLPDLDDEVESVQDEEESIEPEVIQEKAPTQSEDDIELPIIEAAPYALLSIGSSKYKTDKSFVPMEEEQKRKIIARVPTAPIL